ncbi:Acetyltransferase (GNAT) domain-containing protein [Marininema mesophilum]|uniref:Acetyltransferase (GNAT) domain-containing protein n=1 Tax=Marininema mesophilum TaxID=1048340 RepID=A0A1H3AS12_9BACL|nr:GNAT family N-acetyltransferase [Marininema mesophilum]SDX31924.1 Acetyltransferase (GNAT) domain-containing protein [Marininema mesophilum]
MQDQTGFLLDKLSLEDIPKLIDLSSSVGWDYDKQVINTIMSVGHVYGHRTKQGDIISSAAIIPYDNQVASIGMVIVNEKYRGYGLGQEITQHCVNSVSKEVTIMLIATKEGESLYKRLGFQTVTCVHKLLSDSYTPHSPVHESLDYCILPLDDSHFNEVLALDQSAVGVNRGLFLKTRIRQAKQGLVVRGKNGILLGYGLGIEGPVNMILGPIVAINKDVASYIIHNLAKGYQGKIRIDVPDKQHSFLKYLEQCGFKKVSRPPVMIKNSNQLPERKNLLYGIAAQIFG